MSNAYSYFMTCITIRRLKLYNDDEYFQAFIQKALEMFDLRQEENNLLYPSPYYVTEILNIKVSAYWIHGYVEVCHDQ